jgi:hypothetical protein
MATTKNTQLSTVTRNAQADAMARLLDGGFLKLYANAQAATADTALGAQTLLGTLALSATSAPAAVNGILTFNALTSDTAADALGTATWFRALKADGTTVVLDGSVGSSGTPNLLLNTDQIVVGARLDVSGWTHTVPASGSGV